MKNTTFSIQRIINDQSNVNSNTSNPNPIWWGYLRTYTTWGITMIDFRTDITHYSDNELSLMVFNDEYLYSERTNEPYLIALINEQYKYTEEQMKVLKSDLEEDRSE